MAEPVKPKRERKPAAKNDPKHVAAARELRDRWLELVNAGEYTFESAGKYDVTRPSVLASGGATRLHVRPHTVLSRRERDQCHAPAA
jgi:hypothetical protein